MFRHILVPLDGSPRAEQAIPIAGRVLHATRLPMLLVRPEDMLRKARQDRIQHAGAER
jgi:hypothetical protein